MSTGSPPRRQILLAYTLLVSMLAAVWVAAGQPLVSKLGRGAVRAASLELRIDSLERAAARDAALHPELAQRQIDELESFVRRSSIEAGTLEVAGSLLQRRLTGMIRKHGGEPGSLRLATDTEAGTMTVSTRFSADLSDIVGLLVDLRQTHPVILVDLLSIRRRDPYLDVAQGENATGLIVQLDVSAFWAAPAADGAN